MAGAVVLAVVLYWAIEQRVEHSKPDPAPPGALAVVGDISPEHAAWPEGPPAA